MSKPADDRSSQKAILLDIDGCLLHHFGTLHLQLNEPPRRLPGVLAAFTAWERKGYTITLLTGRRESHRAETEAQLKSIGIFWDHLLMGIGRGERHLINDLKPGSDQPTTFAHNLVRNSGLDDLVSL